MALSKIEATPSVGLSTGFASNVTGAIWPLTANSVPDGLAHQVTITNDAVTDHSGKTATITGTDSNGYAQTEVLALPGPSGSVTSTKFFLTVTSVVPSATIGVDTMDIGYTTIAYSYIYPLNHRRAPFEVNLLLAVTGTISLTVEYTLDSLRTPEDILAAAWMPHATLAAITANTNGTITAPVVAIRVKVNSLTAGATAALSIVQA